MRDNNELETIPSAVPPELVRPCFVSILLYINTTLTIKGAS